MALPWKRRGTRGGGPGRGARTHTSRPGRAGQAGSPARRSTPAAPPLRQRPGRRTRPGGTGSGGAAPPPAAPGRASARVLSPISGLGASGPPLPGQRGEERAVHPPQLQALFKRGRGWESEPPRPGRTPHASPTLSHLIFRLMGILRSHFTDEETLRRGEHAPARGPRHAAEPHLCPWGRLSRGRSLASCKGRHSEDGFPGNMSINPFLFPSLLSYSVSVLEQKTCM